MPVALHMAGGGQRKPNTVPPPAAVQSYGTYGSEQALHTLAPP